MRFKATCPHCLEEIPLFIGLFRCNESCSVHKLAPDPLLMARWDDNAPVYETFTAAGVEPRIPYFGTPKSRTKCPGSGVVVTDRVCPKCGRTLYAKFGHGKETRLTLVGAKDSGKSTYIGVLVNEMDTKIAGQFHLEFRGVGDTINEYKTRYRERIFNNKLLPDSTPRASKADPIPPLVYVVRSNENSRATITLFDPPGEVKDREIILYYQFLYRSHGIVLLVDGEGIANGKVSEAINGATEWLSMIVSQLETHSSPLVRQKKPYIAIAISKFDLLKGRADIHEAVWDVRPVIPEWDDQAFRFVSNEIEGFLRSNGGSNLCNMAEINFGADHVGYFAVSQIGFAPTAENKLSKAPEPFLVADPFLWLMAKHRIVPTRLED